MFLSDAFRGAQPFRAGARLPALIFAAAFGLAACSSGGDDDNGGNGGGGNDCRSPHTSGTCTGFSGTAGAAAFTLSGDGAVETNVVGGDEANTFALNGGTVGGNVNSGGGADMITINGAGITGNILGGGGADTITLTSGSDASTSVGNSDWTGYVDGGAGGDIITLGFGTWAAYNGGTGSDARTAYGGADADTFILNGADATIGSVTGAGDDETFTLTSGMVTGNVDGGGGNDEITLEGAAITGNILGGAGDDAITLTSGSAAANTLGADDWTGYVDGGDNGDTITLGFGTWAAYNGGTGSDARTAYGGGGADTLILNGATATITGNIIGDGNADTITLTSGSGAAGTVGASDWQGHVNGGADADTITLGFGTWAAYNGGAPTGSPTGGAIYGGGGADSFTLNGGTISGNIIGSDDTSDSVMASGGELAGRALEGESQAYNEIFVFSGGSVTGNVDTGDGNDLIVLGAIADGVVQETTFAAASYVDAGANNDEIILQAGTWAGYYGGAPVAACTDPAACADPLGTGDNPFADTGTRLYGGGGSDTFILDGADVTNDITGSDEADVITLTSGTVGGIVTGGDGADTITLERGVDITDTYVTGGEGNDTISIGAGVVIEGYFPDEFGMSSNRNNRVYGGGDTDVDTLILDGGTINGNVRGEDGDRLLLKSGMAGILNNLAGTTVIVGEVDTDGPTITGSLFWESTTVLTLVSGSLANIRGSTSAEMIAIGGTAAGGVAGGVIEISPPDVEIGYISGSGGDDTLRMNVGIWHSYDGAETTGTGSNDVLVGGVLFGGGGDDIFILNGATIGLDPDTIDEDQEVLDLFPSLTDPVQRTAFRTSNGNVTGQDTNSSADTFTLMSGTILGNVDGGEGNDVISLGSSQTQILTIGGNVDGGEGDDTVNLNGNIIMPTGTINGGGGAGDTLNYNGGRIYTSADRTTERTDDEIFNIAATDDLFRNFERCGYPNGGTDPGDVGAIAACTEAPSTSGISFQSFEVLTFAPELALAGVLPSALQDFTSAAASFLAVPQEQQSGGLWVREEETLAFGGGGMTLAARGLEGLEANGSYALKMSLTQQGYNKPLTRTGAVVLRSFMHLAEGEVDADVAGHADVQGYGAGMALLWSGDDAYMQAAGLAAWHEADVRHEGDVFSTKGEGFLVSIDAGRAYALRGGLTLRPQMRVLWQSLFLDDFSQDNRRYVFGADERLEARAGLALEGAGLEATAFVVHTGGDAASLTTGMRQDYHPDGLALEARLSGEMAHVSGFAVSGDVTHRLSLEGRRNDFTASLNLSRRF